MRDAIVLLRASCAGPCAPQKKGLIRIWGMRQKSSPNLMSPANRAGLGTGRPGYSPDPVVVASSGPLPSATLHETTAYLRCNNLSASNDRAAKRPCQGKSAGKRFHAFSETSLPESGPLRAAYFFASFFSSWRAWAFSSFNWRRSSSARDMAFWMRVSAAPLKALAFGSRLESSMPLMARN